MLNNKGITHGVLFHSPIFNPNSTLSLLSHHHPTLSSSIAPAKTAITAEPHLFPFFFSLLYLFLTHVSSAPAPYRLPSICVIALQICAYNNNDVAPLTLSASLFSTASPTSAISPVDDIENHHAFYLSSPPWL
ncbi:hypothetical protein PIB30_083824, partial [Stylosanthes scabra]|nr:hypothetical protein [Stylosanthes scabra]